MPRPTPLAQFKAVMTGSASPEEKAATLVGLGPRLPQAALPLLDDYLVGADLLVQVAIMDVYFEMTGDDYHEQDLIDIMARAAALGDEGEQLYMAARMALARVQNEPMDLGSETRLKMVAIRRKARRPARRRGRGGPRRRPRAAAEVVVAESLTIIIHGTWASDGSWWRPGGDFFEYVRADLERDDLYRDEADLFSWSGKNDDGKRRKAALTLSDWLKKHPAAEVNVFAHSHGANVAMLATHDGASIERLVMLSPPVRKDYFADWSKVGSAFNIQACFDPVVMIAKGGKWFGKRGAGKVKEIELEASGHAASHTPDVWRAEGLPTFVGVPWPRRDE